MTPPPASRQQWYFSDEKIQNTPSRRHAISADKEESYRQQAANFIQDMGQRLSVTQLCINTAIVYMHRFYMFHPFSRFHRNSIGAAALFLAAKVEEQPRKLDHVIKISHQCINREHPTLDSRSEQYLEQAQELVSNENMLLQTLGFDVVIDHPHTHVVNCIRLVKASKDLAQTSYIMATNSLHLTTMCLRHPPTVVACVCIYLACSWSNYHIKESLEGRAWYTYVDPNVTLDQLRQLTDEFLAIFKKCPSKLKRKILQSQLETKDEEDRRAKDNTMPSSYKLDLEQRSQSSSRENRGSSLAPQLTGGSSRDSSRSSKERPISGLPSTLAKQLAGSSSMPPGSHSSSSRHPQEQHPRQDSHSRHVDPHGRHSSQQPSDSHHRQQLPSGYSQSSGKVGSSGSSHNSSSRSSQGGQPPSGSSGQPGMPPSSSRSRHPGSSSMPPGAPGSVPGRQDKVPPPSSSSRSKYPDARQQQRDSSASRRDQEARDHAARREQEHASRREQEARDHAARREQEKKREYAKQQALQQQQRGGAPPSQGGVIVPPGGFSHQGFSSSSGSHQPPPPYATGSSNQAQQQQPPPSYTSSSNSTSSSAPPPPGYQTSGGQQPPPPPYPGHGNSSSQSSHHHSSHHKSSSSSSSAAAKAAKQMLPAVNTAAAASHQEKSIFDLSPEKPSSRGGRMSGSFMDSVLGSVNSSGGSGSTTSLPGPPTLPPPPTLPGIQPSSIMPPRFHGNNMNSQVPPSTVANSGAALKPDRGSPPPPYNKQGMQTDPSGRPSHQQLPADDQFGLIKPCGELLLPGSADQLAAASQDQSLDAILGFSNLKQESELSKTLFDDDFDLDMNKGPAGVSEAVSDFSELFNNSDTSTLSLLDAKYAPKPQPPMAPNMNNSSSNKHQSAANNSKPPSQQLPSGSYGSNKQPQLPQMNNSSSQQQSSSSGRTSSPLKIKKESSQSPLKQSSSMKRESSTNSPLKQSTNTPTNIKQESSRSSSNIKDEFKDPMIKHSHLFTPSPEKQMKSEPRTDSSRSRTLSNSQGGEPVVNVQKLESMAPEFQNLTETVRRGAQPSSILVDKDGHPSPTKSLGGGSSHRSSGSARESVPPVSAAPPAPSGGSGSSGSGRDSSSPGKHHHRSDSSSRDKKHSSSSSHHHRSSSNSSTRQPALPSTSTSGSNETLVSPEKSRPPPSTQPQQPPSKPQPPPPTTAVPPVVIHGLKEETTKLDSLDSEENGKHEKKHKEHKKKEKKEKKEKKDKKKDKHGDRERDSKEKEDEHRKKDKKKKKDKDRDRDRERGAGDQEHFKLVIKGSGGHHTASTTTPASSPPPNHKPLPKLKIKLGGTPAVESSERSKKRERSDSSAKLDIPAAKMARVMGTSNQQAEEEFLHHKLGTKKEKKSSK